MEGNPTNDWEMNGLWKMEQAIMNVNGRALRVKPKVGGEFNRELSLTE
jgi:hypothetical protein